MKSIVFAFIAFTTFSAMAQTLISGGNLEQTENPDGSFTIQSPLLLRGNKSLKVSAASDLNGVCKALSFSHYLNASVESPSFDKSNALLNEEGNYTGLVNYNDYYISSITCYNEISPVLRYTESFKNADESVTITGPVYVLGKRSMKVSAASDLKGVCKAMGFENLLSDSVLSPKYDKNNALLSDSGSFSSTVSYNDYYIDEITCMNGANATVFVDAAGKKYIKSASN